MGQLNLKSNPQSEEFPIWNDRMTSMCRTALATYNVTKEFGCHKRRDQNSRVPEGISDTSHRNMDCHKVSCQRAMLINR